MKQIETEILIEASPEKIWAILTDFAKHNKWNPFIKSIRGEKKIGGKLTVSIEPPGGNGMTFQSLDSEKLGRKWYILLLTYWRPMIPWRDT